MADQDFNINIRTTANTAGIQQIQAALQGLGAQVNSINAASGGGGGGGGGEGGAGLLDKAAAKIEHGIFRTAVHAIGIGVVYELVGALREAGKEIEKISEDLDKQGAQLLKNAQLTGGQAKEAQSHSDVLKISDASLKDIETTQKNLNDISQKELGYAAQFSDYLQKQMFARQRLAQLGDYEAAQQENLKTAEAQLQEAQAKAIREVDDALKAQQRDIVQIINDTERLIAADKKRADQAKQNNDAKEYVEAQKSLQLHQAALEKQRAERTKDVTAAQKTIQERYGYPVQTELQEKEVQYNELLQRQKILARPPRDLTPREQEQGRDAFIQNQKDLRDRFVDFEKQRREKEADEVKKRYDQGFTSDKKKADEGDSELLRIAKKILESIQ